MCELATWNHLTDDRKVFWYMLFIYLSFMLCSSSSSRINMFNSLAMTLEETKCFETSVFLKMKNNKVIAVRHVQIDFNLLRGIKHVKIWVLLEICKTSLVLNVLLGWLMLHGIVLIFVDFYACFKTMFKDWYHFFVFFTMLDGNEPVLLDQMLCHKILGK